jgi:hypothetical protein
MCRAAPTSGGFANIDLNPRRPKYSVRFCRSSFLSYHKNVPGRGSPRDGGSAETLSAKRGTIRFAVRQEFF